MKEPTEAQTGSDLCSSGGSWLAGVFGKGGEYGSWACGRAGWGRFGFGVGFCRRGVSVGVPRTILPPAQPDRRRRRRRSLFRIAHARGAIPIEVGPTRCRATPALNQSADETRTPTSQCLPAMPVRRLQSCLETTSADYPSLSLESRRVRRNGGPSGQVTVDQELILPLYLSLVRNVLLLLLPRPPLI